MIIQDMSKELRRKFIIQIPGKIARVNLKRRFLPTLTALSKCRYTVFESDFQKKGYSIFMIKRYFTKNDILLIIGMLLVSGLLMLVLLLSQERGSTVVISVDGKDVKSFSLDEDTRFVIDGYHGGSNVLVIENGEAFLESASCPDKLCVNMGKISKVGQSIICLPNKVVIEIRGKESEEEYDAVVG